MFSFTSEESLKQSISEYINTLPFSWKKEILEWEKQSKIDIKNLDISDPNTKKFNNFLETIKEKKLIKAFNFVKYTNKKDEIISVTCNRDHVYNKISDLQIPRGYFIQIIDNKIVDIARFYEKFTNITPNSYNLYNNCDKILCALKISGFLSILTVRNGIPYITSKKGVGNHYSLLALSILINQFNKADPVNGYDNFSKFIAKLEGKSMGFECAIPGNPLMGDHGAPVSDYSVVCTSLIDENNIIKTYEYIRNEFLDFPGFFLTSHYEINSDIDSDKLKKFYHEIYQKNNIYYNEIIEIFNKYFPNAQFYNTYDYEKYYGKILEGFIISGWNDNSLQVMYKFKILAYLQNSMIFREIGKGKLIDISSFLKEFYMDDNIELITTTNNWIKYVKLNESDDLKNGYFFPTFNKFLELPQIQKEQSFIIISNKELPNVIKFDNSNVSITYIKITGGILQVYDIQYKKLNNIDIPVIIDISNDFEIGTSEYKKREALIKKILEKFPESQTFKTLEELEDKKKQLSIIEKKIKEPIIIVIAFGMPGYGKTFTTNLISESLNIPVFSKDKNPDYLNMAERYILQSKESHPIIIFDRSWPLNSIQKLENFIKKVNGKILPLFFTGGNKFSSFYAAINRQNHIVGKDMSDYDIANVFKMWFELPDVSKYWENFDLKVIINNINYIDPKYQTIFDDFIKNNQILEAVVYFRENKCEIKYNIDIDIININIKECIEKLKSSKQKLLCLDKEILYVAAVLDKDTSLAIDKIIKSYTDIPKRKSPNLHVTIAFGDDVKPEHKDMKDLEMIIKTGDLVIVKNDNGIIITLLCKINDIQYHLTIGTSGKYKPIDAKNAILESFKSEEERTLKELQIIKMVPYEFKSKFTIFYK